MIPLLRRARISPAGYGAIRAREVGPPSFQVAERQAGLVNKKKIGTEPVPALADHEAYDPLIDTFQSHKGVALRGGSTVGDTGSTKYDRPRLEHLAPYTVRAATNLLGMRHLRETEQMGPGHALLAYTFALTSQNTTNAAMDRAAPGAYNWVANGLRETRAAHESGSVPRTNPVDPANPHLPYRPFHPDDYHAILTHAKTGLAPTKSRQMEAALPQFSATPSHLVRGFISPGNHGRQHRRTIVSGGEGLPQIKATKSGFMMELLGHPETASLDTRAYQYMAGTKENGLTMREWAENHPQRYEAVEHHLLHHTEAGKMGREVAGALGSPDHGLPVAQWLAWMAVGNRRKQPFGGPALQGMHANLHPEGTVHGDFWRGMQHINSVSGALGRQHLFLRSRSKAETRLGLVVPFAERLLSAYQDTLGSAAGMHISAHHPNLLAHELAFGE